jgi:hypothetical protein
MSELTNEVVERAKKDPQFLWALVFNPAEATKGLRLTDQERAFIAANTPERLIGGILGVAVAGCGSNPTCDSTCTATCTVTFTSRQDPGELREAFAARRG